MSVFVNALIKLSYINRGRFNTENGVFVHKILSECKYLSYDDFENLDV